MHQAHYGRGKRHGTGNQGRYRKEEDRSRLKQSSKGPLTFDEIEVVDRNHEEPPPPFFL